MVGPESMAKLRVLSLIASYLLSLGLIFACTRESKVRTREDAQLQLITAAALTLKQNMRNPDSFVLESALLMSGKGSVCYTYRAQNGFGGMDRGRAVLIGGFCPWLCGNSYFRYPCLKNFFFKSPTTNDLEVTKA